MVFAVSLQDTQDILINTLLQRGDRAPERRINCFNSFLTESLASLEPGCPPQYSCLNSAVCAILLRRRAPTSFK
jgi:hypothetical protein